ncbi:hypothetical protein CLOM621_07359 [Clostridium sp. M62/1]|nr:hypothetical protein CLOM621_07359 [Clostridium sp. M62/1]
MKKLLFQSRTIWANCLGCDIISPLETAQAVSIKNLEKRRNRKWQF